MLLFEHVACSLPLYEGDDRQFMTLEERRLRRSLIKLLRDDGQGHHHNKYADVLEKGDFDVSIVPIGMKPPTAAIDVERAMIYINRGLLVNPAVFGQLNVIIRHELCHYLFMHEVHMIKLMQDIVPEAHLRTSMSLQELFNVIMDFDISNRKYSKEDKDVVKHTWLNGKIISGLVTDDHRSSWVKLSLEDMYKEFMKEFEEAGGTGQLFDTKSGNLSKNALDLVDYRNVGPRPEFNNLQEYRDYILKSIKTTNGASAEIPENYEQIFNDLQQNIVDDPNVGYTRQDLENLIDAIVKSKPIGRFDLLSEQTGEILTTVYTPEERSVAISALQVIMGDTSYQDDYDAWYNEITKKLQSSSLSEAELQELLNCLA